MKFLLFLALLTRIRRRSTVCMFSILCFSFSLKFKLFEINQFVNFQSEILLFNQGSHFRPYFLCINHIWHKTIILNRALLRFFSRFYFKYREKQLTLWFLFRYFNCCNYKWLLLEIQHWNSVYLLKLRKKSGKETVVSCVHLSHTMHTERGQQVVYYRL